MAAEDRGLRPRANSPQHGALGALVEGHVDLLAALAANHQRMTAAGLASQVLDVGSADLRDPQPVQQQKTHDRLGLRILYGGGE